MSDVFFVAPFPNCLAPALVTSELSLTTWPVSSTVTQRPLVLPI